MNTPNNYSDIRFGLDNSAERYARAVYQLFVLFSSLGGDSLILDASFQKDAFKINKLIVTGFQHIAVSDFAN